MSLADFERSVCVVDRSVECGIRLVLVYYGIAQFVTACRSARWQCCVQRTDMHTARDLTTMTPGQTGLIDATLYSQVLL
jgi:hypothetical protein